MAALSHIPGSRQGHGSVRRPHGHRVCAWIRHHPPCWLAWCREPGHPAAPSAAPHAGCNRLWMGGSTARSRRGAARDGGRAPHMERRGCHRGYTAPVLPAVCTFRSNSGYWGSDSHQRPALLRQFSGRQMLPQYRSQHSTWSSTPYLCILSSCAGLCTKAQWVGVSPKGKKRRKHPISQWLVVMPASSRSPPVSLESLEHLQSPGASTNAEVSGSSPPSHTTDIDHRNYPHSDARLLDATCATDTPYYSYPDVMEGNIDDIISTSTRDHTPSAEPQSATIDFNSISPSTRDHTPCAELQLATIDFEHHLFMEGHFEDIISTSTRDHTPCADPPATIDLHSPLPGGANRDTVRRCSYVCQDERLLLYDAVHATKLPNFMQCRTPLPSPLNIHKWRYYWSDYNDNIVCDFMEFGWPIGYMSPALPQSILQNHASSLAYPAHVDHFIDTELRHGALIGPFPQTHPPFTHVATSPLMSRPKKNSEHRRIIMDFSFPIGHAVNSGIPKDTYLGLPYSKTPLSNYWRLCAFDP